MVVFKAFPKIEMLEHGPARKDAWLYLLHLQCNANDLQNCFIAAAIHLKLFRHERPATHSHRWPGQFRSKPFWRIKQRRSPSRGTDTASARQRSPKEESWAGGYQTPDRPPGWQDGYRGYGFCGDRSAGEGKTGQTNAKSLRNGRYCEGRANRNSRRPPGRSGKNFDGGGVPTRVCGRIIRWQRSVSQADVHLLDLPITNKSRYSTIFFNLSGGSDGSLRGKL